MPKWVEWVEPYGPHAEPVFCRVPLDTAIKHQKNMAERLNAYTYEKDDDALLDFMAVNWAYFIEDPRPTDNQGCIKHDAASVQS